MNVEYVYDDEFGTMGIDAGYDTFDEFAECARQVGWRVPDMDDFHNEGDDADFEDLWPYYLEHGEEYAYVRVDEITSIVITVKWTSDAAAGTDIENPCYVGQVCLLRETSDGGKYMATGFVDHVLDVFIPTIRDDEWIDKTHDEFRSKVLELLAQAFAGTEFAS